MAGYDVIVVGTRAAGAATAMLLARRGLRVLAVDRASFPSDAVSSHQVQVPGGAALRRWGLLDQVVAAGTPAARQARFDPGAVVLHGRFPAMDGVGAVYSPRRTLLDKLLVDAAAGAGAEVRERFAVDEVTTEAGRVSGIAGTGRGGRRVIETAALVVGADGKHSLVARAAGAAVSHERAPRTVACYTYWSGVELAGGEIYARPRRAAGAWPTNDGLVMTYVAWPAAEFDTFRADVEGNLLATLDRCGDLGQRVRQGARAERLRTTPDLPNLVRVPAGPGWALVGDAGLVMDPLTGQGIGHAFMDAEALAGALADGLGGRRPLAAAMAAYERDRNRRSLPMWRFTVDLAALAPPGPEQALFAAVAGDQAETDRFLGVLTGSVPLDGYFAPRNLARLVGLRGLGRMLLARARDSARAA